MTMRGMKVLERPEDKAGFLFVMYQTYRKISEKSDSLKEIFVGTVDLQIGDIVMNNNQDKELFQGVQPMFLELVALDYETGKANGQIGLGLVPCDDPRGRVVDAATLSS